FDAEAIARGYAGRAVRVDDVAHAAVADRVRVDLKSFRARARRDVGHVLGPGEHQSRVAGIVAVRLEQRRAAAAECTVRVELDRADGEESAVVDESSLAQPFFEERAIVAEHRGDADRELLFRRQFARAGGRAVASSYDFVSTRFTRSSERPRP